MKKNNSFLTIIIITLIIILFEFAEENKCATKSFFENSVIEIKPSKDRYLESEPIWIEIDVNIPKDIQIDREPIIYPTCDLNFILTKDNGDKLKYVGMSITTVFLKEHKEHYFALFDLLEFHGVDEDYAGSSAAGRRKLLPDNYSLQVILTLEINHISIYFYSDKIGFQIEKPAGSELEARTKLLEIEDFSLNYKSNFSDEFSQMFKKVSEFKNMFPNSVYLDKAEREIVLSYYLDKDFKDTISNYLLNHFKEKPNNYFNYLHIELMGSLFKGTESSFIKTLEQLRESNKGSILEKIINNYIENVNFQKSLNKK